MSLTIFRFESPTLFAVPDAGEAERVSFLLVVDTERPSATLTVLSHEQDDRVPAFYISKLAVYPDQLTDIGRAFVQAAGILDERDEVLEALVAKHATPDDDGEDS